MRTRRYRPPVRPVRRCAPQGLTAATETDMKWFVIALAFSLVASSCTTFEPVSIDDAGKQLRPGDPIRVTMVNGDSFATEVRGVGPKGIRVAPGSVRAMKSADGELSKIPPDGLSFLPFDGILTIEQGHPLYYGKFLFYLVLGTGMFVALLFLTPEGFFIRALFSEL